MVRDGRWQKTMSLSQLPWLFGDVAMYTYIYIYNIHTLIICIYIYIHRFYREREKGKRKNPIVTLLTYEAQLIDLFWSILSCLAASPTLVEQESTGGSNLMDVHHSYKVLTRNRYLGE